MSEFDKVNDAAKRRTKPSKAHSWESLAKIIQIAEVVSDDSLIALASEVELNKSRLTLIAEQLAVRDTNEHPELAQSVVYCAKSGQVFGLGFCSDENASNISPQWIRTGYDDLEKLAAKEPVGYAVYLLGQLCRKYQNNVGNKGPVSATIESEQAFRQFKAKLYASLMQKEFDELASLVNVIELSLKVENQLISKKATERLSGFVFNSNKDLNTVDTVLQWVGEVLANLVDGFCLQLDNDVSETSEELQNRAQQVLTINENRIDNALRGLAKQPMNALLGREVNFMQRSVHLASVIKKQKLDKVAELQDLADEFLNMMDD